MVELAKTAGFCYGVDRAVGMVYDLLEKGKKVATVGPIIHNPQIVSDLAEKGVIIVNEPKEVPKGYVLVIRSHGVGKIVTDEAEDLALELADATCPFVKKIHRLATRAGEEGKVFLFFGDADHPEVMGVVGHCTGEYYVVKNESGLYELWQNNPDLAQKSIFVAAQTTFNTNEWKNCLKTLKKLCTNHEVFDTICNATVLRQAEAKILSENSDVMIVVGGRESSNTAKLFSICNENAETYLVETAKELPNLEGSLKIGITAGASTPASIIKEVLVTMSDMNQIAEQNFEEMLEESLKSFNTDEKVRGIVVGITPTEVYVDVGRKQAGFVPANELSQDPNVRPEDIVKMGDEIDLLIMKTNDQEGTIMLSKKRVDAMKGWDDIEAALESQEVLTGKVIEVVKGGVIVLSKNMRIFVPASQATTSRGEDLNGLKNKEVNFRVIEVNRGRRRAVGSIRSVLKEQRKAAQEKFWTDIQEGQRFTGKVKSFTNFGAFIDLGGVDGMVHISELSWNRVKHPSDVLSIGETVEVFVKGLDRENGKISLGYKDPSQNPWEKLEKEYPAGTVCEATIVGLTDFGAFANVIPGIDGLIHISQIADRRIEKPQDVLAVGDKVNVKITEIDFENHRVSLSMRALLEDSQAEAAKADNGEAEVVYSTEAE
ncbi:bifunctional 4-hydroxy-3-methylbut-2-enyl diphosphate reductase/30S ribosomal protein S1 [Scatolibacter rhodanostii]|uniref:bifunctional 4-hydroxy-3-methylbut-2-enyl diphosphate reductase/30S ribosomal protein S1 n=1 Tax=Scatolibacter rhodanostii TaxID=2014781 RepID=UPI000C089B3D|nr:bifunctional 4-hydroxy-3-methylbut-2-enyl diphosphate reductase/30S ribosomal protein S1 [Scatolibacter rhodanostii]